MDAKLFLHTVVPWNSGYVTIHWHRAKHKGFFGESCQSVDAALAVIDKAAKVDFYNIYFCISSQKLNSGQRDREHASGLLCLPMDLDIKQDSPKHYSSLAEAIAELFTFCDCLGIPRPGLLVFTGGGLHAYWLSQRVLAVDEWQPFADALKAAARNYGLKFDPTCTGDAARVLRVPGTKNWKYDPQPIVRVLPKYSSLDTLDFNEAFEPLGSVKPKPKVVVADAFKHIPIKPVDVKVDDHPPLPVEPILAECAWLREAYETGGKDFDEPQWNLTTLIATFLKDGHDLAHRFGNQHPDYTFEETERKWDRKNQERRAKGFGWPLCGTVDSSGSQHCRSCRHFGKIKSPVSLGYVAFTTAADDELKTLGGTRPPDFRLPDGYCLNNERQICAIVPPKKMKNGWSSMRLHRLFMTEIEPPVLQYQDDCFGIGFVSHTDRGGTAEVFLQAIHCYKSTGDHLAKNSVQTVNDKGTKPMVDVFAESWLHKLMKSDVAIRDTGTMGWRYDKGERIGFVFGNTLYHVDGTELTLMTSSDNDFRSWYKPTGSKEAWLKAAKLLIDRKRPELDIIIAIGFAAPLMTFAGTLYGAIVSIWGEPGTSKSTAQMVAAAIWGHPKQTRESLNSTPKSVQGRLGRCRNLAAFWDDVQDERHQDRLFETMFVATQGTEGGRLNQDASMKERLDWQTLLVVCANASFIEYLTKKQKSTTAGMRRVFEIEFHKKADEPGIINSTDAGRVFAALEQNYGVIGVEYAKILATEHKAIDQLVADTMKEFCASVEGTSDEAYWWGCCGVLLAGAKLAKRLGVEIDIETMQTFLQYMFRYNRTIRAIEGTEGGSRTHTEHALVSFINHFVGSRYALHTDKLYDKSKPKTTENKVIPGRTPDHGHRIVVQIVHGERKVIFSKKEMRDYLQDKDIQVRQVFSGLETFFLAKEARHTLGAGTSLAQSQEVCFEIYVPKDGPHVLSDMIGTPKD